jgi:hypothetical protein
MKMNFEQIRMTIGVTGHRDIPSQDIEQVKDVVRNQLLKLKVEYPDTPILILSGLAEGADRLVVRVAQELDIRYAAILPLEISDYQTDFQSQESKQEFFELVKNAEWTKVLPKPEQDERDIQIRERCYENLGFFLVKHSQILIALWDGETLEKTGGTSQVVRYFQQNIDRHVSDKAFHDLNLKIRPVLHIHCRRDNHKIPQSQSLVAKVKWIWPIDSISNQPDPSNPWVLVQKRQGEFNTDSAIFLQNNTEKVKASLGYLLGDLSVFEQLPPDLKRIAIFFAVCDSMSINAQGLRKGNFKHLVIVAYLAIISQQCYGFFLLWFLLILSAGLTLISFLIFAVSQKKRYEDTYLDYRSLAEGLRVQFFWRAAGVDHNVSDYFLTDQRDELDWIRDTIQFVSIKDNDLNSAFDVNWINKHWITDQRTYFIGDVKTNRLGASRFSARTERLFQRWMKILFFSGLSLMMLTALGREFFYINLPIDWRDILVNSLLAFAGCLLCMVPTLKLYADTMGYDEHAKRYLRIGQNYFHVEDYLSDLSDNVMIKKSYLHIGKQSLQENSDWLLLHRQRPVKVPVI